MVDSSSDPWGRPDKDGQNLQPIKGIDSFPHHSENEHMMSAGELLEGRLWYQRKGKILTIGLTSRALDEVGEIERISLSEEEEFLDQEDVVCTIEGQEGELEIPSPVKGSILAVNKRVHEEPEVVMDDPLEEGWLVKIEIESTAEVDRFEAETRNRPDKPAKKRA